MRENFDDRVKEWLPSKISNLIVKLEDDKSFNDFDKAKLVNTMPSKFGSYNLSHSKRIMNEVIKQIGGFLIIVFPTQIPNICIYIKNTGLTCLIMDLWIKVLAWVKMITGIGFILYLVFSSKYKVLFSN